MLLTELPTTSLLHARLSLLRVGPRPHEHWMLVRVKEEGKGEALLSQLSLDYLWH
jgi:hypothetical protein